MNVPRRQSAPRWSTAALVGGGVAGALLGVVLGARFSTGGATANRQAATWVAANTVPGSQGTAPGEKSGRATASHSAQAEANWNRWASRPGSLARDEQMAQALEMLAAVDPARALALALEQSNQALRQNLVAAALRGWASVAPDAAADWSLRRPFAERGTDVAAVLASAAADDPERALELATRFVREDPALAHDHGCALIFALTRVGEFETAAGFASAGAAANRGAWLDTAFAVWAEHQPPTAAAAAAALPDAAEREAASLTVMSRWATIDPHGLSDFALNLPADSVRRFAINSALTEWANQDAGAAAAWINQLEPSALLDAGVAAVAIQPPLITYRPQVALNWAESIFDPGLRQHTLAIVVEQWAKADRIAARRYAETSPAVDANDRPALLAAPTLQLDE